VPRTPPLTDDGRRARAGLAWLLDPSAPVLRNLAHRQLADMPLDHLLNRTLATTGGLRREVRHLTNAALRAGATNAVAQAVAYGMRVVIPNDPEWPVGLADLADPARDPAQPAALCLWVRGDYSLATVLDRSVAVVGARAATAYGQHVATDLGTELARHGWTIVATGGYGIDAAAQRGALCVDGLVVAAIPGGLDRPYPAGNAPLFEQIADQGLLVSMWPPGAEPTRDRAVVNRALLAVLARGTVLVEAAVLSGSLTTLHQSVAAARPAMAVPGPITSVMSAGCHHAVRDLPQVRLVTGAVQIIAELSPVGTDQGSR
jgi:DNA processing protein